MSSKFIQDFKQETRFFQSPAPNLSVHDCVRWIHGTHYFDQVGHEINGTSPQDDEKLAVADIELNFRVFWHWHGILYVRRSKASSNPNYNNFSRHKIKAIRTHEWNEEFQKWKYSNSFVPFRTIARKKLAKLIYKAKKESKELSKPKPKPNNNVVAKSVNRRSERLKAKTK